MALPDTPDVREAARRFGLGGCCGRVAQVRYADLAALGITPVPGRFESSLGPIAPLSGWKALCVWVHEVLGGPFPRQDAADPEDPGELVQAAILGALGVT